MKISKTLRTLMMLALIPLLVGSCDIFEERSRVFDGDPGLEFSPLNESTDEGVDEAATIQLIGEQRDSDLTVSVAVSGESTAQAGVHYNLNSTTATISAGTSAVDLPIDVLDNTDDDGGQSWRLILTLQDSQGVEAEPNLNTYTLTINGVDG